MTNLPLLFPVLLTLILISGCSKNDLPPAPIPVYIDAIPATIQHPENADAGWDYLRYGNYFGGGIPADVFHLIFPIDENNELQREGDNATLGPEFIATMVEDRKVISNSCFSCHASYINGEYIVGLGDAKSNFTANQGSQFQLIKNLIINNYGTDSPEFEHSKEIMDSYIKAAPHIIADFKGVNPAFDLERAAVAHRNPDMTWSDTPLFDLPESNMSSDTPAWWLLKKKNGLYFNGMGRGDFTKLLMQTSVVGITDSTAARAIHQHFDDVLAFIESIEAPAYPGTIDANKSSIGEALFSENCQQCHGKYGPEAYYPNRLIDVNIVGTDPAYAERFLNGDGLVNWYNSSWMSTSYPQSKLDPKHAYIAPPLDGVWATAPYLHNGSIPNLYSLLNSAARPNFWVRDFDDSTYDLDLVGWPYDEKAQGGDENIYDTQLPGYGNQGHTFGDGFSEEERMALIEYLKGL